MDLKLVTDHADPFKVLQTTQEVLDRARCVRIHTNAIAVFAFLLYAHLSAQKKRTLHCAGTLEYETQKIFVQNALNFCFWAEYNISKWTVEWPEGILHKGGWFSLVAALDRAEKEEYPIYDAKYLSKISHADARHIFRGEMSTHIPLFEQRVKNLRESGLVLCKQAGGSFHNIISATGYDAIELVRAITLNFKSFYDSAFYGTQEVFFHKRAQICAHDIALLGSVFPRLSLTNIDRLTGFADYRLPQIYRHFKVLEYSPYLSQIVDSQTLIPAGSRMEIEIRAATVWIVELLRQYFDGAYTSGEIDNATWDMGQELRENMVPHHRAWSIYY